MRTAEFTILEPMATGDIIDRAVRIYRKNFTAMTAIVAVPSVIGYLASALFWSAYYRLLQEAQSGVPVTSLLMMLGGAIFYVLWLFSITLAICGLARVVGDFVILGEAVSFRKCLAAIRHRFTDLLVLFLIGIGIGLLFYAIVAGIAFVFMFVMVILLGLLSTSGLPGWVVGTLAIILGLAALAGMIIAVLMVASRVILMPQVVMIEGQSAGSSIGRAINLGAGNWYKLAGIALFSYFVHSSLLAAFMLPFLAILYLTGSLTQDFFVRPTWSAFSSAFGEITNLLVLPIWIISFTLLYFDSRVRKEGYDVDLLTRSLDPTLEADLTSPRLAVAAAGRSPVQTSPLGLAGYVPAPPAAMTETEKCEDSQLQQP
jgi:hypothetical protein